MKDIAERLCDILAGHALDGDGPALHAMRDALKTTGVITALENDKRYRCLFHGPEPFCFRGEVYNTKAEADAAIDSAMRE